MNDFNLYNKYRLFNDCLFKKVIHNVPKVYNTLRIKLEDTSIKLMEDIFYAYYNVGNIRKKYMIECLVDLSMIDYLLRFFYDNKLIVKKNYLELMSKFTDIKNLIYSWKNSEEGK